MANTLIMQELLKLKDNVFGTNVLNGSPLNESIDSSQPISGSSVMNARRLRQDEDSFRGKTFVYLDGPQQGMYETIDYTVQIGSKYSVIFQSGLQMEVNDLNIKMVEAENYQKSVKKIDGLRYEDEFDIDTIKPSKGKVQPVQNNIPPPPALNNRLIEGLEVIDKIESGPTYQVSEPLPVKHIEVNPILNLLEKMKKTSTNLELSLTLNLPSKSAFNMIIETFENSEDDIIEYLTTGKQLRDLKEAFKKSLLEYFKDEPVNLEDDKDKTIHEQ